MTLELPTLLSIACLRHRCVVWMPHAALPCGSESSDGAWLWQQPVILQWSGQCWPRLWLWLSPPLPRPSGTSICTARNGYVTPIAEDGCELTDGTCTSPLPATGTCRCLVAPSYCPLGALFEPLAQAAGLACPHLCSGREGQLEKKWIWLPIEAEWVLDEYSFFFFFF